MSANSTEISTTFLFDDSINDTSTESTEISATFSFDDSLNETSTTSIATTAWITNGATSGLSSILSTTTTTTGFRQILPIQLNYTITPASTINLPSNVTSDPVMKESYPEIENMIKSRLSNIYINISVVINEARIIRKSEQLRWKLSEAQSASMYYLYVNATLQLPFECPSGHPCRDEIQAALEQTPPTLLQLTTENGNVTIEAEKPTVQGLKSSSSKPNLIGLIVGIVMAVLSALLLVGVTGYVIVRRRKQKRQDNEFHGAFDLPITQKYLKRNQHGYGTKVFSCELAEQNPLHSTFARCVKNWVGPLGNGFKIKAIDIIQNRDKFNHFRQQIEIVERRMEQSVFQPNLNLENNVAEREKVLKRLQNLYNQVDHKRKAKIVRVWHGCDKEVLPKLLADGFSSLAVRNNGWFGKGMYFSSSAQYASRYCPEENPCLLMCYVLVLNPFPVISSDAPKYVKPIQFRFYGRGNHSTYQCHFIPVSPVTDKTSKMNFRPPERIDDARYDELVVFESANILPQVVVHLERTLPPSQKIRNVPTPKVIPRTNKPITMETKNHDQNDNVANRRRRRRNGFPTEDTVEMNLIKAVVDRYDGDDYDRRQPDDRRQKVNNYNASVIDIPMNDNSWRKIVNPNQPFDR
ncbi:unnamed protein product [Rotaria sp. Silwood2]|nr:unnamed protein product [Rotaria sp. Silwood2]